MLTNFGSFFIITNFLDSAGDGKEVRDSALTGLQSGMTLRQCSETYWIRKKTLSKLKSQESRIYESGSEQAEQNSGDKKDHGKMPTLPPGIRPIKIRVIRKHKVEVLTDAALCIPEGMTFQQVSEKFDVPKTTLRDFMVRLDVVCFKEDFQRKENLTVGLQQLYQFHL
ncbi:unnamed protein product [Orchesella dallaii]|uniref:HTH psq-type domain-containing protein n=1 Tax=Orchesella dallaii TaxID=48710 RepID=A0ABP1PZI8_9HEXA